MISKINLIKVISISVCVHVCAYVLVCMSVPMEVKGYGEVSSIILHLRQ